MQQKTKTIAIIIGIFIAFSLLISNCEDEKPKEEIKAIDNTVLENPKENSLFSNVDDFKNSFNNFSETNKSDLIIKNFDVGGGTSCMLKSGFFIAIGSDEKKHLNSVSFVGTDESYKSTKDILHCIYGIISSTNPKLSISECDTIFKKIGLSGNYNIKNIDAWTVKNGVKYRMYSYPSSILFEATPY